MATTDTTLTGVTAIAHADGSLDIHVPPQTDTAPTPPLPALLPPPTGFTAALNAAGTAIVCIWSVVAGALSYVLHDSSDGSDPDTSPTATRYPTSSLTVSVPVTQGASAVMHRLCPCAVDAAGVQGPCAADIMVMVPAAPVVTSPPPPPPSNLPVVPILAQFPNHDSVVIKFGLITGGADYWIRDTGAPGTAKAAGGPTYPNLGYGLIEFNGTAKGQLIVEALDALAPFLNTMVMAPAPGMMTVKNGQGDPSNLPKVIAASAPFTPHYQPRALTGTQAFFDSFPTASFVVVDDGDKVMKRQFHSADGNWRFTGFNINNRDTTVFAMADHIMDDIYAGGTPGSGLPLDIQNANLTYELQHALDLSAGGTIAHFGMEWDACFDPDGRRLMQFLFIPAEDQVLDPENMPMLSNGSIDFSAIKPNTSGQCLLIRTDGTHNKAYMFTWENGHKVIHQVNVVEWTDPQTGAAQSPADRFGPALRGVAEGTTHPYKGIVTLNDYQRKLDLRHDFNAFLVPPGGAYPNGRLVFTETDEEKVLVKSIDKPLPVNLWTVFPSKRIKMVWMHQFYHPTLEKTEIDNTVWSYFINRTPHYDRRHGDNAVAEVLTALPAGL